jgi:DNA-directed RNA polymerase specialized sigma24 family protein
VGGKQATGAIAALEDFEAVFREHFAPVHRFIARRVGMALAEDLAAEVFAIAYRRRQPNACIAIGVSDQGSTSTPIYTNHG